LGVFKQTLDKIMNSEKMSRRTSPYYLLVTVEDGYSGPPAFGNSNEMLGNIARASSSMDLTGKRVSRARWIILDTPPKVPLLGSSLFKVDNVKGKLDCMWCLPRDEPRMVEKRVGSMNNAVLHKSAEGMPIMY